MNNYILVSDLWTLLSRRQLGDVANEENSHKSDPMTKIIIKIR